jgi:uncharacterized protein YwqG
MPFRIKRIMDKLIFGVCGMADFLSNSIDEREFENKDHHNVLFFYACNGGGINVVS